MRALCAILGCGVLSACHFFGVDPIPCEDEANCAPGTFCVEGLCEDAPLELLPCGQRHNVDEDHICAERAYSCAVAFDLDDDLPTCDDVCADVGSTCLGTQANNNADPCVDEGGQRCGGTADTNICHCSRPPAPGLIAHWPLDDRRGTLTADAAGALTLTQVDNLVRTPTPNAEFDVARNLEGSARQVPSTEDAGRLHVPEMSISLRVNLRGSGSMGLLSQGQNYALFTVDDALHFRYRGLEGTEELSAPAVLTPGTRQTYAVRFVPPTLALFVDGEKVIQRDDAPALDYDEDGTTFSLGSAPGASIYDGFLDDVRVSDPARSDAELEAIIPN